MADPYSPNPFAEEMREQNPARYAEVAQFKDPPKLFGGGTSDTPAFTASGIDPQLLLKLPVGMRHAAAANPDINQVHRWFEDYASIPDAVVPHQGLDEAKLRVQDWLDNTDTDPRTPEQRQADDLAAYEVYERRLSPQGVTMRERAEQRAAQWQAKQEAIAAQRERQARAQAERNRQNWLRWQ